ncbi:CHAT domain-containing protein [Roseofilum sp. BLCC_M91]|uniref:CHAT domain-containing protein n=1 Tax=Roseofilum halophilum BLCC-M91 TaxID=3022259 RepID=A0ABT7BMT1_9CYAN|nr:CHAT domain-containing tetratricopeptide repeat protein [Roseofilum halophilum]MDJ1180496.1 CHAT domain-containing protein [Roseofilum halophilum BLCC-M91]
MKKWIGFTVLGLAIAPLLNFPTLSSSGASADVPMAIAQENSAQIDALILEGIESRKQRDYEESIAQLEEAIQQAQNLGEPHLEHKARTFLALTYRVMGELETVLQLYEENLALVRQNPATEWNSETRQTERQSLEHLAGAYSSLGNYAKAIEFLAKNLNLIEQISINPADLSYPKVQMKLGINLFLDGQLKEAEQALKKAFDRYTQARELRVNAGSPSVTEYEFQVETLRWLQQVLVAQNKIEEALEWSESARSRAFIVLLGERLAQDRGISLEVEAPNIDQIRQIARQQDSTLVSYTLTYEYRPDLLLRFNRQATFSERLQPTGVLIWVVKPNGEITFKQVAISEDRGRLDNLVQRVRGNLVRGRVTAEQPRQFTDLYQSLIAPISRELPNDPNARVTFIPQDTLFLIPFAAIPDGEGQFLIDRHTILTAPSIQVLEFTRSQQQSLDHSIRAALVVGNPTMPDDLSSLPGAEIEAQAIAKKLNISPLIGNQATESAVTGRMGGARLIHLATHGLLDDQQSGFLGSLSFTPEANTNGYLESREIIALQLNAELVVLSACDTGRGEITGDGVLGLSRAFIAAGTSSIVVSLWKVPDDPTGLLMQSFYQNLQNGLDKAQALRQAMLKTRQEYPNPFNWGAFTLIGEPSISPTLQAVLGGQAEVATLSEEDSTQTASRYQVFPLPDEIEFYQEFPSALIAGEKDAFFSTSLTVAEIFAFYRNAFAQEGLEENLTLKGDEQMVFDRPDKNHRIVIQVSSAQENQRTVLIRLEPM